MACGGNVTIEGGLHFDAVLNYRIYPLGKFQLFNLKWYKCERNFNQYSQLKFESKTNHSNS